MLPDPYQGHSHVYGWISDTDTGDEKGDVGVRFPEDSPSLAVVVPCRNEAAYIEACIESIIVAIRDINAEILIVDGMSTDGTREIARNIMSKDDRVRLIDNPSTVTPVGLNLGIRASKTDLVGVLGAHSTVSPDYFVSLMRILAEFPEAGCAGGVLVPQRIARGFQRVAGQVLASRFGVGDSSFRVGVSQPTIADTAAYAVYRADILNVVGVFDERLIRNQDIELSHRIVKAGYRIIVDPNAVAYYVPRASLVPFCQQALGNGMWNVMTHRFAPGSLSARHFVPMIAVLGGALLLALSFAHPSATILLSLLTALYASAAVLEATRIAVRERDLLFLWCAPLFLCLHVSYGLGSIAGLIRTNSW